ncbi:hypothetical protein N5P37_002661 [Trichoderma harzianum]|nr:hypothetical protein N5P37_002661 [Trichoderma harzianum]
METRVVEDRGISWKKEREPLQVARRRLCARSASSHPTGETPSSQAGVTQCLASCSAQMISRGSSSSEGTKWPNLCSGSISGDGLRGGRDLCARDALVDGAVWLRFEFFAGPVVLSTSMRHDSRASAPLPLFQSRKWLHLSNVSNLLFFSAPVWKRKHNPFATPASSLHATYGVGSTVARVLLGT